jgi:hypothetical protein
VVPETHTGRCDRMRPLPPPPPHGHSVPKPQPYYAVVELDRLGRLASINLGASGPSLAVSSSSPITWLVESIGTTGVLLDVKGSGDE